MLLAWYQGELKDLPPITDSPISIDALLERKLLGRLKDPVTIEQLTKAVMELPGGVFYHNRYAISADFLKRTFTKESQDLLAIWQEVLELYVRTPDQPAITAATVTAALVLKISGSSILSCAA